MTVGPRRQQSWKPEGGEPSAMVPVRLRPSPVRGAGSWWLGLDGSLPRTVRELTAADRAFALTDILIRPHPQDRVLTSPVQERLLNGHQASSDATLLDRHGRSTAAALLSPGWPDIGKLHGPARPTTPRAPAFSPGEGTTARLRGRVTMPGGGGPGGP